MKSLKKQRGITFITLTLLLSALVFIVYIGLKIGPIYANSFTVESALKSLVEDGLFDRTPAGIFDKLQRRFEVNGIDFIQRDNISVSTVGGTMVIEINYVEQRPVIGNLEVLATFNKSISVDVR